MTIYRINIKTFLLLILHPPALVCPKAQHMNIKPVSFCEALKCETSLNPAQAKLVVVYKLHLELMAYRNDKKFVYLKANFLKHKNSECWYSRSKMAGRDAEKRTHSWLFSLWLPLRILSLLCSYKESDPSTVQHAPGT